MFDSGRGPTNSVERQYASMITPMKVNYMSTQKINHSSISKLPPVVNELSGYAIAEVSPHRDMNQKQIFKKVYKPIDREKRAKSLFKSHAV